MEQKAIYPATRPLVGTIIPFIAIVGSHLVGLWTKISCCFLFPPKPDHFLHVARCVLRTSWHKQTPANRNILIDFRVISESWWFSLRFLSGCSFRTSFQHVRCFTANSVDNVFCFFNQVGTDLVPVVHQFSFWWSKSFRRNHPLKSPFSSSWLFHLQLISQIFLRSLF